MTCRSELMQLDAGNIKTTGPSKLWHIGGWSTHGDWGFYIHPSVKGAAAGAAIGAAVGGPVGAAIGGAFFGIFGPGDTGVDDPKKPS